MHVYTEVQTLVCLFTLIALNAWLITAKDNISSTVAAELIGK